MAKVRSKINLNNETEEETKETNSKSKKIQDPQFRLGKEKDPKEKRKKNLEKKKKLSETPREEIDLFSLEKRM